MDQTINGKIIRELRISKSITQKELADLCNIDIRTVQRIECGEVIPRFSTLKLLADVLGVPVEHLREQRSSRKVNPQFYRFAWIIGIFQLLNLIPLVFWRDYESTIGNSDLKVFLIFPLLHIVFGILFYSGFYVWGRDRNIKLLVIPAVVLILIIPISEIILILSLYNVITYGIVVATTLRIIIGINRIIFGFGIFRIRNNYRYLVFITGTLMMFTGLLCIIPISSIQMANTVLYFPVILMLIILLYRESKNILDKDEVTESS